MLYKPTKYRQKTWLPRPLIEQSTADNWLDSLGYFVRIRSLHQKPIFYNCSLRKIAAKLGCSPATIKHHLYILSSHELLSFCGPHLVLKSGNEFRVESKFMVPVGVSLKKQDQRNYLRWALTKHVFHIQARVIEQKNNALKFHNGKVKGSKQYKECRKAAQNLTSAKAIESSLQNTLTLGNKKFGSINNRSQSTGIKIQKAFRELKLIKTFKRVKLIDSIKLGQRAFYESCYDASHFLSNTGYPCKRLSNGIVIQR